MSKQQDVEKIVECGIVAIVRADSPEKLTDVAQALLDGGIDVIEVTFTVPGVLEVLSAIRQRLGDRILLGAGTVLDSESARAALLAGAQFIVSPSLNLDVIRLCHRYDKVVMPGALTPTEVQTAWDAGADFVKIFPASVGGPGYLKALHGPFPQVRTLPTGGVNLNTLPDFLKSGACAVGLGGALVEKNAVQTGDMNRISHLAVQYVELVKSTRLAMS